MRKFVLAASALLMSAASASAQVVYNNTFDVNNNGFGGNTQVWSTPTDCTIALCGNYLGLSGESSTYRGGGSGLTFSDADVARLTLNGLGAHVGGTLMFKLFILDSWDGNEGDRFQVAINGTQMFDASFADPRFVGPRTQSFPSQFDGGVTNNTPGDGALQNGNIGSWFWDGELKSDGTPLDGSIYQIAIKFTGDAPDLVVDFRGKTDNQGMTDESWALDDVSVRLNARDVTGTPEPATVALVATGLLGIGGFARRRARIE